MSQSTKHRSPSHIRQKHPGGSAVADREPLRVLLVEDDPNDELIVRQCLNRSKFFECAITSANNMQSAKFCAKTAEFDVMLLDFWVKAEDSLSILADQADQIFLAPAVVISSMDMTDVQAKSLRAGALAYLHKNDLSASALDATLRTLLHTSSGQARLRHSIATTENARETMRGQTSGLANQVLDTLTAVSDLAETLSKFHEKGDVGISASTYTNLIRDNSERLMGLLQQHLSGAGELSKVKSLNYKTGCLIDCVEQAATTMEARCAAKHQEIDIVTSVDKLSAAFDAPALQQALINILANASKFGAIGAPIRVTVDPVGTQAKIAIIDQGIGMNEAQLRALQAPEVPGTPATGLSVARSIVELHGGTIDFESFPEWGTTVTLNLPLKRPTLN